MAEFLFKHPLGGAARPRRPFDTFGANGVLSEFVTLKSAKRLKVAPLPVVVGSEGAKYGVTKARSIVVAKVGGGPLFTN